MDNEALFIVLINELKKAKNLYRLMEILSQLELDLCRVGGDERIKEQVVCVKKAINQLGIVPEDLQ